MRMQLIITTLASTLIVAQTAHAYDFGGYVGVSVGEAKAKDVQSASELDAQNAADGFTTSSSVDDTDTSWKLFIGHKFNRNFAIEGSYNDLGESTADTVVIDAPPPPVGFGTGTLNQTVEAWTLGVAAVGILPLGYNFDLFGKAGVHYWDAEWTVNANLTNLSGSVTEDDNGTDLFYGIGAAYNFTERLALRAEWELFENIGDDDTMGESDVEMWTAGIQLTF